MKEAQFTIIVPIYNEEENLFRLEQELVAYLRAATQQTKVLLINDGSTDNSQERIEAMCFRNKEFIHLSFDKNYGLSAAIKAGFDHVETPLVGYMDADLQTSPADFDLLLEHIPEYDLVVGIRVHRQDSLVKNVSSRVANRIRRAFTDDGVEDTGCPLKVFKTSFAKKVPMFKGLHRFFPAMVLLQNGKVKQVPVRHFPRVEGSTKFGLVNRLFGPLVDCFAYLWIKRKYINYALRESDE